MPEIKQLSYMKNNIGFVIAKSIMEESLPFEIFKEIISKYDKTFNKTSMKLGEKTYFDSNVNANVWPQQSSLVGDFYKEGIAQIQTSKVHSDYGFQFLDKNGNVISGLYQNHRPMAGFEFDYSNWKSGKLLLFAYNLQSGDNNKLEETINNFFTKTGLEISIFDGNEVAEFNKKKEDVRYTLDHLKKSSKGLHNKKIMKDFSYEILQGNNLFDRFVSYGDLGF